MDYLIGDTSLKDINAQNSQKQSERRYIEYISAAKTEDITSFISKFMVQQSQNSN